MAIVDFFKPQQQQPGGFQQTASQAARQRAIADAIAGRAMQSRAPVQQGRITPSMGFGEGLAQIGEALIARRAGKKASNLEAQAEEQRRKAQAAALARMSGQQDPNAVGPPSPANPYATAQEAIQAGLDPALVSQYLASQQPGDLVEVIGPDGTPTFVRENEAVGMQPFVNTGVGAKPPASIAEYNLARSQGYDGTFEQWQNERTRGQIIEFEGAKYVFNPATKQYTPLSTVEGEADAAATIEGAKTEAQVEAEARATAAADLPRVQQTAQTMLENIDGLLNHEGFDAIFGKSSALRPWLIPGSAAADAKARLEQLQGATFLQAYQQLKGGGQISEVEGLKAENAIARLQTAQSEEAAREALSDLREVVKGSTERARAEAGKSDGDLEALLQKYGQ